MAIFGGLLDLVLLVFLVLVFAEYTKIRAKYDKAFKFLTASALMFLLAFVFTGLDFWVMIPASIYGTYLFEFIGWLFVLIGTLFGALEMLKK